MACVSQPNRAVSLRAWIGARGLAYAIGATLLVASPARAAPTLACLAEAVSPTTASASGWRARLGAWLPRWAAGRPELDLALFERARERYARMIRDGQATSLPTRTQRPETKLALVFAVIERDGAQWLELPVNSRRAQKFMAAIAPKPGKLTALEARQVIRRWFLLSRYGRRLDTDDIFIWDSVTPEIERLADAHLAAHALRIQTVPDMIEFFGQVGMRDPGFVEHLRTQGHAIRPYLDLARTAAYNAFSIYVTGRPLPINVRDTALAIVRPSRELVDRYLNGEPAGKLARESRLFATQLRIEQGLRVARSMYVSYIFLAALQAVVYNWKDVVRGVRAAPAWVAAAPGWAWTAWTARDLSQERMQAIERDTYDAQAVIDEQYRAWLEGLDEYVPSEDEKRRQLEFLRKLEGLGCLRVHSRPAVCDELAAPP